MPKGELNILEVPVPADLLPKLKKSQESLDLAISSADRKKYEGEKPWDYHRIRFKSGRNYVDYEFEGMTLIKDGVKFLFGDRTVVNIKT